MPRRHTRLNLPPLFSISKSNDLPKQDPTISATFLRLSRIHARLHNKEQSCPQDSNQADPQRIPSSVLLQLDRKESIEGEDENIWKTKFSKKVRTKDRDSTEASGPDDTLQVTQLPILARKSIITECRNEFRKELKRNTECTPLSTVIVRWSIRKDMPDTLYRWFILQDLCKYGPIESVIFSGHRCAQVVFSDILSACKAINTHSVRVAEQRYHCFWHYPFMKQNYRF
ncbi:testis expressed protein 56-like [Stegostoma tigrinum]|uniref:testis expressed protein 56-like n=1 Tax=Stegostoma tigrinum TaxID=3053191 RepID=UPI00286FD1F2|nr:testis expressed protein 56-like [Stegostoma tigrinum]